MQRGRTSNQWNWRYVWVRRLVVAIAKRNQNIGKETITKRREALQRRPSYWGQNFPHRNQLSQQLSDALCQAKWRSSTAKDCERLPRSSSEFLKRKVGSRKNRIAHNPEQNLRSTRHTKYSGDLLRSPDQDGMALLAVVPDAPKFSTFTHLSCQ